MESILDAIGSTPLIRLNRISASFPCTVLAKVEYFNPGGSVKDRIGVAMIEAAERDGTLRPGGTIIEGTSGNTGAGIALAAIARGYKCIFTTTDKQSQEKLDVLRAYGAEVMVCPTNVAPEDPRSYYQVARRLAREIPGSVYLNQYDNPANAEAHYQTTGPELWEQTGGKITHLIASAGTGGTISGIAKYLKERNPSIKIIGVDTFGSVYHKYFYTREFDETEIYPYVTEGVGEDILAGNMNFDTVDDFVRATDRDNMLMTRRLAREEGLFVGQSSGLAVCGAMQWMTDHQDSLSASDVVVIILPDSGFRYLSKTFNDSWMRNHGFLEGEADIRAGDVAPPPPEGGVIAVGPDDTLGDAIERMMGHGISQLPVMEDGQIVGSITESIVLNQLIEEPGARSHKVSANMAEPLPVISPDLPLDALTRLLGQAPGAVMVLSGNAYSIITKSDVIDALSRR